jgi:hypothetical protein
MGPLSASAALQLPVRMRGIQLGQPVDLIVDAEGWHVIGFVVRCGDASRRFLPWAACQLTADEILVGSALMLLEDVGFYEQRGASFRSLLGGEVGLEGGLRDLVLGPAGAVTSLVVELDGDLRRVPAAGATVVPTRATAA